MPEGCRDTLPGYNGCPSSRAGLSAALTWGFAMTGVRIDKWLWAARFFKTRAMASRACDLGRVLSQGHTIKPAHPVHVGDKVQVTNDSGEFQIEVLALSEVRGPAPVAQALYRESEASREARQKAAAERKAAMSFEILPAGRPSKRDRRRIIQFRGRGN